MHNVAFNMAARIGNFEGLSFEEPLRDLFHDLDETIHIKEVWGHRLDTGLKTARVEGDHPSCFFGAFFEGSLERKNLVLAMCSLSEREC